MKKSVIGKAIFHLWIPYGVLTQIASMHFPALNNDIVKAVLLFGGLAVFGSALALLPKEYMAWRDTSPPSSRINRWVKAGLYTAIGAVLALAFHYCVGGWLQMQFGRQAFQSGVGVFVAVGLIFTTTMIMYVALILSGVTGLFNPAQNEEAGGLDSQNH